MTRGARALTAVAALFMIGAFAVPLWQIRLLAPQYPEGLGLLIHVGTVRGAGHNDLANINSLNHYIGMKPIDPAAIPVLRIMPWVLGGLVAGAFAAALAGRRRLLAAWLGAYAAAAALGLLEFWKWERDYGRDLDLENAIIKVPGMSYEPPLIGAKQLLNFTAISLPALGTVLLAVAFVLGAHALFLSLRAGRTGGLPARLGRIAASAIAILLAGCGAGPAPIAYDADGCDYCRMQISDPRYGAELITRTGKVHRFDSIECLASFYASLRDSASVSSIWVSDYREPGAFLPAGEALYVQRAGPGSPMGRGLLALKSGSEATAAGAPAGDTLSWHQVVELLVREGLAQGMRPAGATAAAAAGVADVHGQ